VVGAKAAEFALAACDLALEFVDQPQTRLDRALPGLGQSELGEQSTRR
jgi:hypothetical protein